MIIDSHTHYGLNSPWGNFTPEFVLSVIGDSVDYAICSNLEGLDSINRKSELDCNLDMIRIAKKYKQFKPLAVCQPDKSLDTNVIKDFNGSTDGMWRDLVAKGKRVLVLSLSGTAKASRIPGDGETNEPLGSDELNGKFIILDGLNFQSSDAKALIKYVEL